MTNDESKQKITMDVDYNQLGPGDKKGDVAGPDGFSIFPGNVSRFIIRSDMYLKILNETKGVIAEFVNPKCTDNTKTKCKKPNASSTFAINDSENINTLYNNNYKNKEIHNCSGNSYGGGYGGRGRGRGRGGGGFRGYKFIRNGDRICYKWNIHKGNCWYGKNCRYKHVCKIWEKEHHVFSCHMFTSITKQIVVTSKHATRFNWNFSSL